MSNESPEAEKKAKKEAKQTPNLLSTLQSIAQSSQPLLRSFDGMGKQLKMFNGLMSNLTILQRSLNAKGFRLRYSALETQRLQEFMSGISSHEGIALDVFKNLPKIKALQDSVLEKSTQELEEVKKELMKEREKNKVLIEQIKEYERRAKEKLKQSATIV